MTSQPSPSADLVRKHARALRDAGRLHARQGHLQAAEECLSHALDVYRDLEEPLEIATSAEYLADMRSSQDAHDAALELLHEAARAIEHHGEHERLAATYLRVAQVHMRRRRPELAREYFEQALRRVSPDDSRTRARIFIQEGTLDRNQGALERALERCNEARTLLDVDDGEERARCANLMGTVLGRLGRHSEAATALEESLSLHRAAGHRRGEAQTLNNLGIVLLGQGDRARARELFEEALVLCDSLDDAAARSSTLNNLGVVAKQLGDLDAAAAHYSASQSVATGLDDPHLLAIALRNRALISYLRGQFSDAETKSLNALRWCRQLGDRMGEIDCLERIVLCAIATDRGEAMRERVTELERALDGVDDPSATARLGCFRAHVSLASSRSTEAQDLARATADDPHATEDDRRWARALASICAATLSAGAARTFATTHSAGANEDTDDPETVLLRVLTTVTALRHVEFIADDVHTLADDAATRASTSGAHGWRVQVHEAAAMALARTGDREQPVLHLERAIAIAVEHALGEQVGRVRARLRDLGRAAASGSRAALAADMTLPHAQLQTLCALARTVAAQAATTDVATHLARLAVEHFEATACAIYLTDESEPAGQYGSVPLAFDPATRTQLDADAPASCVRLDNDDLVVCTAPMRSEADVLGLLVVALPTGRCWTDDDAQLLTAMANVAAPSIQNARLVSELENARDILSAENTALREGAEERGGFDAFVGRSPRMQRLYETLERVSQTRMHVLVRGENGTGKELAARSIHFRSTRRTRPFIRLNCAAIPESLVESELFGVEDGTATGVKKRIGRFEQATGGTLFLDEIGDMPLSAQAKLLRAVQEQEIERVGGRTPIAIDVRIVAATNRDLELAVEQGDFRRDLYYRLRVIEVELPALRDHSEDIPLLAMHSLERLRASENKVIDGFTEAAWARMQVHQWPGNVRELEHAIAQAVILCDGSRIDLCHMPALNERQSPTPDADSIVTLIEQGASLRDVLDRIEFLTLRHALDRAPSRAEAAKRLGIGRSTFYDKLKEHGLLSDTRRATTIKGAPT